MRIQPEEFISTVAEKRFQVVKSVSGFYELFPAREGWNWQIPHIAMTLGN
jgi:hypothetical protein